ncbi:MAG: hypothetical protein AAB382_08795, partial [Chloroflexota bacterium]
DGNRIVFVSNRDGDFDLCIMNADGSNVLNLTNNAVDDDSPSWSPDGQFIAFSSERDGNRELYRMKPAGTNVVRLTNELSFDLSPAYSPDGSQIAFVSNRDGIWRFNGTLLLFDSNREGNYELYVLDLSTLAVTRLTNNSVFDADPAWQP